jgi:23S rRNA (cytosine1962-C5)-methyltransferase
MKRITLTTQPTKDYELLDSGGEEKLERYGSVVLARPDPQALWEKRLGEGEWAKAQGRFERKGKEGIWHATDLPKEWQIEFGNLKFLIKPTSFKHTGLFPEQLSNWEWVGGTLSTKFAKKKSSDLPSGSGQTFSSQILPSVLNLFGYTGGASLAAAAAGASVTHVDASKTAVTWARENAKLSGLEHAPIRWIVEDAMKFVKREISRGTKYDGIVMDPPAFGHGPKDELWKIEEDFVEMVKLCQQLLSDKPLFFLINGYAAGYSPSAFAYNLEPLVKKFGGDIEYGDLAIEESSPSTVLGIKRTLPAGIFARWSR